MSAEWPTLLVDLLLSSAVVLASLQPLRAGILLLALQSTVLSLLTLTVAKATPATLVTALVVFGVKAVLIPWLLLRLERHTEPAPPPLFPGLWSWVASGLVLLMLNPAQPLVAGTLVPRPLLLTVALDLVLLGLLVMIRRRLLLAQVVGIVVIENGLYAAGLSVSGGLPLVLDWGVLIDLLLAVFILGWLFRRARLLFAGAHADDLSQLRG